MPREGSWGSGSATGGTSSSRLEAQATVTLLRCDRIGTLILFQVS